LPEVVAQLRAHRALVLEAPPGAGKTTRVPRALLDAGLVDGEIVVLEPRRLAARLAARRVADELGEAVGERVGYRVRFEDRAGPRTRILFVTEGLLLRRLIDDPQLGGVGAVVLDEFHERHLPADLALALCAGLQASRPSLRLLVMSATLEAEPVARFLDCPSLRAEGRRFEVAIEYAERTAPADRPLEAEVAAALRRLVTDGLAGDVLVFLPGAAEIRRAAAACAPLAAAHDLDVVALHGDLPPEEQDRAVTPGRRRKVILSTNVAETSVTIEGVAAVIDSGLHRGASHSPWSGLPTLRVQRISRASAAQRAGRAGRTGPGRCLRLYTRHDHDARPAHDAPEVRRTDLAEAVLQLAGAGVADPARFGWFESPPPAALDAATALLARLGARDDAGALTDVGRQLLRFPVHPRQARILVEAERRGVGAVGCLVAALVGERPIVARAVGGARAESGPSDLLADVDRFAEAERSRLQPDRLRGLGLDVGATLSVDKVRRQLRGLLGKRSAAAAAPDAVDAALLVSILAGYPDRVARRRQPRGSELVLSNGWTARLAESSVVRDAELMVAYDVEERQEQGARAAATVRGASRIEADWLLDLFADRLRESVEPRWNGAAERVEVVRRLSYDQLVLDETRARPGPDDADAVAAVLYGEARTRGARSFVDDEGVDQALGRVALIASAFPELGLPALDEAAVDAALRALCQGRAGFDELRAASLVDELLAPLDPKQRRALDELAPERVQLHAGRTARVTYRAGQPPSVASRLQDFFGLREGPRVGRGRVPLTLHLLAPNQRAVQVTSDLAGFWERHYPSLRRELGRRYPRHAWPEDPRTAAPPQRR
jgi:ATP-dependent helicase HrpB